MIRTLARIAFCAGLACLYAGAHAGDDAATTVTASEMQGIYDEVKTPYKYGVVIPRPEGGGAVDCPNVYRVGETWYMIYVQLVGKIGYETHLAKSKDLLEWEPLGTVLPFAKTGWDAWQADASVALVTPEWGTPPTMQKFNDKYWLTYIGGALQGYETDPLSIGVASTDDNTKAEGWTRYAQNPVMGPKDAGARWFEPTTLYKSTVLWDREKRLGWPFVMYYNAKCQPDPKKRSVERIGMAVSDDMLHWKRFGKEPVIDNHKGISGDPQIVKIGDTYVMFYFGAGWGKGGWAFDTFAASKNLVHWTKWSGENLIQPSETYDKTFAHKPWLLKHDGVVYHFYCATGKQGRCIALATSKDLGTSPHNVKITPTPLANGKTTTKSITKE